MEPDSLSLPPKEMRAFGYQVVDLLVEHLVNLRTAPALRSADRPALESLLREPVPEEGSDPEAVLRQAQRDIFGHIAHLDHPRFFGFVPSPSNFVSVMADALAAGFNVFNGSWLVASGPAQVELVTIDWLRALCGLPETAGGLFVSGGSVANLIGLAVARRQKLEDRIENAVVYYSDQTHSASERALRLLGFRADQIRVLPSDNHFRLPLAELRRAVQADRERGRRPFCVVANAGTINTGSVDPLEELGDFCRKEDLWLHADATYGGPAILTDRGQAALRGLEQVDSLALDPHKWLFQPFELGCILLRDADRLAETFAVHPEYLRDVDRETEEVNFRDYGIQLTRSFRALKLWMSLKVFGLDAFRRAIDHGIDLAERAEEILRASDHWEVLAPAQLGIVAFRFTAPALSPEEEDAVNGRMVDAMMASGFALLTSTVLSGRTILRLCTINPRTTEEDIRETIEKLEQIGKLLTPHHFIFVGVTTSQSSILRIFPRWRELLDLGDVEIEGYDLPIHAPPEKYREVVERVKRNERDIGALVTTHKLDLFAAAHDLFDEIDEYAALLREVNGIAVREGRLLGYAKDPVAAGRTLAEMLDADYFRRTGAHVLCFGAGGAGQAIVLRLLTQEDRPARIVVTDRSADRLAGLDDLLRRLDAEVSVDRIHNADPAVHDALLVDLPPHSLIINATGMGKDIPGSPITDAAQFPEEGIVWELNYRGELPFLHQARAQEASRRLRVEDGWRQFIHGWTTVMEEVFQRPISAEELERLAAAAEFARPARP